MSPEQVINSAAIDARSDIYSLGGVAYQLLTGRAPFVKRSTMEMMAAQLAEPAEPLRTHRADVPEDLQAVVLRCLEKEPQSRYADASSLSQALAACACAGGWTNEEATAWWQRHAARPAAAEAGSAPADPRNRTVDAAPLVVASMAAGGNDSARAS